MHKSEIEIAKTVLAVLHNYDESEFEELVEDAVVLPDDPIQREGCALLDYDLDKKPIVSLPNTVSHIAEMITEHLLASDHSDPWGMLEDNAIVLKLSDNPVSRSGRILLFRTDYISAVLAKLFPNEKITPAEQKTLLQSLSGLSLKQAATMDSVSYETKKTQLRSVFRKTRINKQQVLSNFLITHLTLEVAARHSRRPAGAESDENFFLYVDQYMGSYVRASVIQDASGSRFRIIELGDPAGTPVVCIHHLGLINFSENEIAEIYRRKIRLICPLRHGALGPTDPKISPEEHFEHAMGGISLAISLTGESKVTIIGLLSGSLYAIRYIERNPRAVDKFIMLGTSYRQPQAGGAKSRFKNNLHQLASDHQRTLELTVSKLLSRVDEPESLKTVMKESHNNSVADFQTIDELFADDTQVRALQHRLSNSPLSIVQDLQLQAESDWSPLLNSKYDTQIHFIHGSNDTLVPIDEIRNLVDQRLRFWLHTVEGAGNWIFGKFTSKTFSIVREILEKSD